MSTYPRETGRQTTPPEENVWILHDTPEGKQAIQLRVALLYPKWTLARQVGRHSRVGGALDTPSEYPCAFLAPIRFDFNQRLVLDEWWNRIW